MIILKSGDLSSFKLKTSPGTYILLATRDIITNRDKKIFHSLLTSFKRRIVL
jgi:hypothetical protein